MDVAVTRRCRLPALLAGIALAAACGGDSSAQLTPALPEVVVTSVQRGGVPVERTYSGRTAGSRDVEISIPESEAALLRGTLTTSRPPTVRLVLHDGTEQATPGTLTFIGNAVDRRSGVVLARAVLPNAGVALLPGQPVSVRLSGVSLVAAVSLPRRAVMTSTNGSFVWVVGKGQVVERRPVVPGRAIGERMLIQEGLTGGERVIVESVLEVEPGITVKIVNSAKPGTRTAAVIPAVSPTRDPVRRGIAKKGRA
jgi:RND family efflux transporter MFP subunit